MNSLSFHEPTTPVQLSDMRTTNRFEVSDLLIVLKWGTGQIIEIGPTGLSFGCLYPHILPEEWSMDILDAQGMHLRNIRVRKVWEKVFDHTATTSRYEVATGVEFIDLTTEQMFEINKLVNRIESTTMNQLLVELELSTFQNPSII